MKQTNGTMEKTVTEQNIKTSYCNLTILKREKTNARYTVTSMALILYQKFKDNNEPNNTTWLC